jgi:hypothetical protein
VDVDVDGGAEPVPEQIFFDLEIFLRDSPRASERRLELDRALAASSPRLGEARIFG